MEPMVRIDSKMLASLGKDLRTTQPAVYRALRMALIEAGEAIANRAREHASWSTRIPGTIKVGFQAPATVTVRAGGGKNSPAPHAKAYEHAGSPGNFRHPVFGDPTLGRSEWTWVPQQARPFLHPAQVEELPVTVEAIEHAIQAVVDQTLGE